jgi:hypothetical protein
MTLSLTALRCAECRFAECHYAECRGAVLAASINQRSGGLLLGSEILGLHGFAWVFTLVELLRVTTEINM